MTQKPFGVKQLNVIGAAGTPTIESAGDLNIGGQQVAITTNTSIAGVITATSFFGDGSGLTGITGSGSGVVIQEEGSSVGTAGTINFIGTGVTATLSGGIASVEITSTGGGGGGIDGISTTGTSFFNQLNVSGVSTFQGDAYFGDNVKLRLGDSQDLEIYHDGTFSRISDVGSGPLLLETNGSSIQLNKGTTHNMLVATPDGSVDLYHNGNQKLATTGTGATVYGTTESQQLNVTGVATFQSSVNLGELDRINFYTSNTGIYGNSNGLNIEASGTNDILIKSNSSGSNAGDVKLRTVEGGRIDLTGTGGVGIYHTDTALKLETTGTGATVYGLSLIHI